MATDSCATQEVVNFAVQASSAQSVTLCLFTEDSLQMGKVLHEIPLDPAVNRTGSIWHLAVPGLDRSLLYGKYRPNCHCCC